MSAGLERGPSTWHGERSLKANLYSELQAVMKKTTVKNVHFAFLIKKEAVISKVESSLNAV